MTSITKLLTWRFVILLSVLIWSRGFLKGDAAQVFSLQLNSIVKPTDSFSLLSGNGTFAAGFIHAGTGAYAFGIWYAVIPNYTVVWIANRDRLVDRNSSLVLTQNGNLVLSNSKGNVVWATNTSGNGVDKAVLQENGTLALLASSGEPVWESYRSLTDTFLPMQQFQKEIPLVSNKNESTYSSGNYKLSFNSDNRLSLTYTGETVTSSNEYWVDLNSTDAALQYELTGGGGDLIVVSGGLSTTGVIFISDGLNFMTSDSGEGHLRRLTLGSDGNLRVYYWDQISSRWSIVWRAIQQHCKIYGMCGPNAICVDSLDDTHSCICPPGFHPKSSNDTLLSLGCDPNIALLNCTSTNVQSHRFISMAFVNYPGHDLLQLSSVTLKDCKTACLNNCSCVGFYYIYDERLTWQVTGVPNCFLKDKLLSGYQSPDAGRMFIKVSVLESAKNGTNFINFMNQNCLPGVQLNYPKLVIGSRQIVRLVSVSTSIFILEIIIGTAAAYFLMAKYMVLREARRYSLEILSGRPKKFTYAELEVATDNFSNVLGKGGYGTVYKGYLRDQTPVAVKRIDRISEGEEKFWAEVTIICTIHHLNLVRTRGFCTQGEHRLLVYEYVPNGSLDTHLFSANTQLDWKKRYQIALGTGRGIAYLHDECQEWILHCDIKPQNVLLDDNFCPKVSDFGVSKLFNREMALSVSTIRGTRGYLAPEWMKLVQPITAKADVYSFGMVLLEIVSGRPNFQFSKSALDEEEGMRWCFPMWAHKLVMEGKLKEVVDSRIVEDPGIRWDEVERVMKTAFWCIQSEPSLRPCMGKVVQMLAGNVSIEEPKGLNFFPFLQEISAPFPPPWVPFSLDSS